MNITARVRPYVKVLTRLGYEVEGLSVTGSSHYKIYTTVNGVKRFFIAPFSCSDRRGLKNFESQAKRLLKQT